MNKTKIVCPKCGAEFVTPETTHISVGLVIGQDSNLGTIYPEVKEQTTTPQSINTVKPTNKKVMNAEEKIEALRKAGVNVSNLFSLKGGASGDAIARLDNDGNLKMLADNDPVFQAIAAEKVIPDRRLFRRWVAAQYCEMSTQKDWKTSRTIGFTEALNRKGYRYQWRMLIDELNAQRKMLAHGDIVCLKERDRWFNTDVVVSMASEYIAFLENHISKLRVRKCKGIPYVKLGSKNIFVADISSKVLRPLKHQVFNMSKAKDAHQLYMTVSSFYYLIQQTYYVNSIPMSKAFKDAYKGAGAYFTLKNFIMFHNYTFGGMSTKASLSKLTTLANDRNLEGYKLLGVLKDFLSCNNVDIKAKQAEWRNK